RRAFAAFLEDELRIEEPRVTQLCTGKLIQPMIEEVDRLAKLTMIEEVASTQAKRSGELLTKLADHAEGLMKETLKEMHDRVNEIRTVALEVLNDARGNSHRGMSSG